MAPEFDGAVRGQPWLDEAALADLRDAVGAEVFAGLVAEFLDEATRLLDALSMLAATGNEPEIRRQAHRLAGLLGQFGCTAAATLCADLEEAAAPVGGESTRRAADVGRAAVASLRRRLAAG